MEDKKRHLLNSLNSKIKHNNFLIINTRFKLLYKLVLLIKYRMKYVNRVLCRSLNIKKNVLAKTFWGGELKLPLYDGDAASLYYLGFLPDEEIKLTKFIIKNIKKYDVFYDIGANYGFYSFLVREIIGNLGEVHLFEPVEEVFYFTNLNLGDKVFANKVAVTDRCGSIKFYKSLTHNYSSSGISTSVKEVKEIMREEYEGIIVKSITIDSYIKNNSYPTILKIDVEGGEYKVLIGGENFLKNKKPTVIMEVWGGDRGLSFSIKACKKLINLGYYPNAIDKNGEISKVRNIEKFILKMKSPFENLIFKKLK